MKHVIRIMAVVLTVVVALGCNKLKLPDNWQEQNFESTSFFKYLGGVDKTQAWNVANQGTSLTGIVVTPIETKAGVEICGNNGQSNVDPSKITMTPAEYFRIIWGPDKKNKPNKQIFHIKLVKIDSEMDKLTIGAYYYDKDGVKHEQDLFKDYTPESYSNNEVKVELQGGSYFGIYVECTKGGKTEKFYSESKYNSDKIGHVKYIAKSDQIQETSNHPYLFIEDTAGQTDCYNIVLQVVDNEDLFEDSAPNIAGLDIDMGPWIVMYEDLGTEADNDFNDVIFRVRRLSETQIEITFMAAGCTLPNYVYLGEENLGEIHSIFGLSDTKIMVNTYSVDTKFVTIKRNVPASFTMSSENMGGFKIKRGDTEGQIFDANYEGLVPQMICVPSDYKWATETTKIFEAYLQFEGWAKNKAQNQDWYNYPEEDKVVY